MKYLRMKLTNYIAIYNGLGINEIEIDFSKAKNKIIMIKGDNGSGKSTIYNALHPFPDTNDCFIPDLPAEKQIDIQFDDVIYYIRISHGINKMGAREVTKAYIKKGSVYTNEVEELNENGNVGSFKDVIFSELSLDPNYLALTALSGNNRGLADMKPADRKKYVNAIIKDLVEYNDIYKTLTKRSSTFKSMINNLSNKISNIGNEETLKNTLISLENRLNKLMETKDLLIEQISESKSMIKVLDPNGENINLYNSLYSEINTLMAKRDELVNQKIKAMKQINISESEINETYTITKEKYIQTTTDIQITENKIQSILEDKEKQAKELEELNVKLYSYTSDKNFDDIVSQMEKLRVELSEYESVLSNMNTNNLLSLDEYDILLKLIDDINISIYNIKDTYDTNIIDMNIDYDENIKINIEQELSNIKEQLIYYNSLENLLNKLNIRPKECSIDSCGFIQDALDALNKDPKMNIDLLLKRQNDLEQKLNIMNNNKEAYTQYNKFINEYNIIIRTINNYNSLLNKCNIYLSEELILDSIRSSYNFYNEINTINQYKDTVNILIMYNKIKEEINLLTADYQTYLNKKEIIDYISSSIEQLQYGTQEILNTLESNNANLLELKQKQVITKQVLDILQDIIKYNSEIYTLENNISDINSKLYALQNSINNIKGHISKVQELSKELEYVNKQINPLINDRDTIKYNIKLLEEYVNELYTFKEKYSKIETIKKHCSPTKGIQLIFIELYMNSTLALANEMLSMLFEGKYILKPFNINENEFKIPCVGSGLGNDDISSMSTGEICMISMILSFSLLQQSSTKYNILKLDEIDGGLDTNNRRMFVSLLDKLMNILGVEQIIMISHNNEIPLDNTDLILLRLHDDIYSKNNVIYRF